MSEAALKMETEPRRLSAIVIRKYDGIRHEHKKRPPDDSFDALCWVLLARVKEKGDFRTVLKRVYHDGAGEFVCTDGHRMHVANIAKYSKIVPAGCLEVVHADPVKMVLAVTAENFMAYANLLERAGKASQETTRKGMVQNLKDNGNRDSLSFIFYIYKFTGRALNVLYAADVFRGQNSMMVSTEDSENESTPVYFWSDGSDSCPRLRAIVMPLKV